MDTCRIDDCERPIKIKGQRLCGLHYARWWKHGDPLAWKKKVRQYCTIEGCDLGVESHGLCAKHDQRLRRYGTTDLPERPTVCTVEGCGRAVASRALCDRHYRRAKNGQDVERRCRFCGGLLDPNMHAQRIYCSKDCKEREQAVQRRETHRERWLKQYGLTPEEYEEMMAAQEGLCAICRGEQHNGRNWCVDHDHVTGKVRGILCMACNTALGNFRDDPAILAAAIRYLT